MNLLITIIVLTALSGIGGTGIGAAISTTVRKGSDKAMSLLLSFASGTMISIVCLDLFHDALETGMAKEGIEILFENMKDKSMNPVERRYPLTLIERDSV